MLKQLTFVICLILGGLSQFAQARGLPQVEFSGDFEKPRTLLHRSRGLHKKFELSLFATPTIAEKYISHVGGMATLDFHIYDVLFIELMGGYLYMTESNLIAGRGNGSVRAINGTTREPNLPDMFGMTWLASLNIGIAPIYAKINLFSELDFNGQFYFIGGIGMSGVVKRLAEKPIVHSSQDIEVPTSYSEQVIKPVGNIGVGFRLFLLKWLAIRVEARDFIFTDTYGFISEGQIETDFIHNFMGLFGVTFILNS